MIQLVKSTQGWQISSKQKFGCDKIDNYNLAIGLTSNCPLADGLAWFGAGRNAGGMRGIDEISFFYR